jgi:hypothetical protein
VVEQPIRNRQVASSTLALGSKISFVSSALRTSVNWPILRRCTDGAHSEFFAKRVHRVHLRFVHGLDVDILIFWVIPILLWRKIA